MPDVLFVCYGNICRSPIAEGLFDVALTRLLGQGHDVVVSSAGVGATDGTPATRHAVSAAKARGADISRHQATRLTPVLARRSKLILCMTPDQVAEAGAMAPEVDVRLLGPEGVFDPIGAGRDTYDEVADLIETLIGPIADEIASARAGEKR
jgi:protein-tyrosine-phosphatase